MTRTVHDADDYWQRYYHEQFTPGLGTEQILAALGRIPPVRTWLDLGAGSESLFWSIPLTARHLIAVDHDPTRLGILSRYAAAETPRSAYETVLRLCDRTADDFVSRCRSLAATITADCLTRPLPITPGSVDLVTQFGLLGLTPNRDQFLTGWAHVHALVRPGGWCAGANWIPTVPDGTRVALTESLYRDAFTSTGVHAHLLTRVPITGDPDFTGLWLYLGRRHS
ncbi:class I SAM-dependent methyltransferase [Micromonospora sp. WMMD1082]|uniref:class I SAM-dependent methyltransferase n=1 Tax=Micromonospora sp. WMMD1082 TaxID=3016104 RepID=UPI0024166C1C|nr:class I SAM-dependent methyltransferase [Micromonospora sp. WMMD1082]MDG4795140.1 class I SAM-dependent methyltransferase [Micromonospora sp. WMMD1082]